MSNDAPPAGPLADRLYKGAPWIFFSRLIVNLLGLASTFLLARLLAPEDFGLVAIATTISVVLASITDVPIWLPLVQHRTPERSHFDTAWTLSLLRGVCLAAAMYLAAEPAAEIYEDPRLVELIYVIATGTVLSGLGSPRMVVYERQLVFWPGLVVNVSQKLAGLVASLFVVVIWKTYWGLVAAILAGQIVWIILSYILAPYWPRLDVSRTKELLSFSIWISLGQTLTTLNYRADQLAVGYILGHAPLGYYTAGENLASIPTREATAPLSYMLFPAFSRISTDVQRLRAAYIRAQIALCTIAFPVGVGFATIAEPLTRLALGDKWLPAVPVIQVLSCLFALQSLFSMSQQLALSVAQTRRLFVRDLVNLCVRIPIMLTGLIGWGFYGLLVARCVGGVIDASISMTLTRAILGLSVRTQIIANWRSFTATGVMAVAVLLLQAELVRSEVNYSLIGQMFAMVSVGIAAYGISAFGLWRFAGMPTGIESTALEFLKRAVSNFSTRER